VSFLPTASHSALANVMQQAPEETFIQGTPSSRAARRTYLAVGIGVGLLLAILPNLLRYADRDLLVQHRYARATANMAISLRCLSAPLFINAVGARLLGLHAARVVAARRWSLPGARVAVDTPIVRGTSTLVRGVGVLVVALLFGVMTTCAGAFSWQFADVPTVPSKRGP
jgi:hypothetical protein